jgi:hypothetical protein
MKKQQARRTREHQLTGTANVARTLKRLAAPLALAACLVAPMAEATATTRPKQGVSHKQRPETGVIATGRPESGIIQQGRPESGVIASGRPESGVIQSGPRRATSVAAPFTVGVCRTVSPGRPSGRDRPAAAGPGLQPQRDGRPGWFPMRTVLRRLVSSISPAIAASGVFAAAAQAALKSRQRQRDRSPRLARARTGCDGGRREGSEPSPAAARAGALPRGGAAPAGRAGARRAEPEPRRHRPGAGRLPRNGRRSPTHFSGRNARKPSLPKPAGLSGISGPCGTTFEPRRVVETPAAPRR